MFARPVDPFFAYNSAFSAAERRHKEMELLAQQNNNNHSSQQELGSQQTPRLDTNQAPSSATIHSKRRKHSLHFEPEFLSALDSSLQDPPPVLSRPRPCKKLRRSTAAMSVNENHLASNTTNSASNSFAQSRTSPPTAVPETLCPKEQRASTTLPRFLSSSSKTTDGPSIIDLSSGEELIAMNVGQSDHKRPRESLTESSSSSSVESLREVYDVQEDGSLCPVLDHAPALPSPAKRSRIDSSTNDNGPLRSLDELVQGRERKRQIKRSLARATHMHSAVTTNNATNNVTTISNSYGYRDEVMMDTTGWMSDDDDCHNNNTHQKAARPEMALIRYEGPKTVTLADGVDALIRKRWNDDHDIPSLDNLQGNELVLYRPPPPRALLDNDDNDDEPSLTVIEELDDDDNIYQATHASIENPDSLIHELEDKIMDMDLD
ncbi:hypothetical protein BG015_003552 [Linnemannia schmuckeri]|uniref:Uncharacterized protein n=1 Tax=Linnemannia schmuckeri TaxID=64567 RepID=A0A9P5RL50_9FUNG|nr:hypothetical protein BG015_003552 [Linnemannia schmuckeri]